MMFDVTPIVEWFLKHGYPVHEMNHHYNNYLDAVHEANTSCNPAVKNVYYKMAYMRFIEAIDTSLDQDRIIETMTRRIE